MELWKNEFEWNNLNALINKIISYAEV
ncbi:hypothetical protein [Plasmodium yoelii yoelii]|uniref:Uncharacterized protein n=1 Tax=Plasmodium yoelii yoelii TaxID=73239 RepID=Q7PCT2_PLAYO|nr:hypothetical protein [Plasmodium yoelii yoelii]EAA18205.1 hypothetical protein [Plasmodium yoelii yoelii]EAA19005.1 hypothetical protein [Plasmodium yoelii yoelii]EAA21367.1 hypothetical protein [Plasmodium yoelii yoelii]